MKIGPASDVSCLLKLPYLILHYEVFQKTAANVVIFFNFQECPEQHQVLYEVYNRYSKAEDS